MSDIKLTQSQERVFKRICNFLNNPNEDVFILKGYAGTGKTTMMKFVVDYLLKKERHICLLAPTGRAVKVLRDKTEISDSNMINISTLHSLIYAYDGFNKPDEELETIRMDKDTGQLYIVFGASSIDDKDKERPICVYIVDEASMISDRETKHVIQAKFGTGRVLTEFLNYDNRKGTKFIFIGDPCQLPPVNDTYSAALFSKSFTDRGLKVVEDELTEIIRQADTNSIIYTSKNVRNQIDLAPEYYPNRNIKVWGKLPFRNSNDIKLCNNRDQLINDYISKIQDFDYNRATFICRSNKSCRINSLDIRKKLGFNTNEIISKNDLLLVIQNNHITGLINGDMVKILSISPASTRRANLTFRTIEVEEIISKRVYNQLIIEEIVNQDVLNLNAVQQTDLYKDFIIRMRDKGIKPKDLQFKQRLLDDPYLNALRCTYGYALTCQKAQGGEWEDVYLDLPRNITLNPTKETFRWIYTAITRASCTLHLIDDFYIN